MRKNWAMQQVAVLALDRVMPFECGIPHRVLGSAHDASGLPLYAVQTCTLDGGPVQTAADFSIHVEHGIELVMDADMVIIPPFGSPDDSLEETVCEQVRRALDAMHPGARVVSLCGAAYLLAAVGRLDQLAATTHWSLTDHFRAVFPQVILDPGVLFVDHGQVVTAAGAAAGIDCCLHLVRRDHGAEVANAVARHCVVAPHREGGQRQFIERPMAVVPHEVSTSGSRTWALQHLDQQLTLKDLARVANLSVRSFTRRFRAETGTSPGAWLLQERLDLARRLLETSELPVEQVAARTGFGSATGLRAHFATHVGVSPAAYRKTFTGS